MTPGYRKEIVMKVQILRPGGPPQVTLVPDATCVYVTINGWVYYLEDDGDEAHLSRWPDCNCTDMCSCDADDYYKLVPVKEVDN